MQQDQMIRKLFYFLLSSFIPWIVEINCARNNHTVTYSKNDAIKFFPDERTLEESSMLHPGLPGQKPLTSISSSSSSTSLPSSKIPAVERIKEVVRGSSQKLSKDFKSIDSTGSKLRLDDSNFNEGDYFIKSPLDKVKYDRSKFLNLVNYPALDLTSTSSPRDKYFKKLESKRKKRIKSTKRERELNVTKFSRTLTNSPCIVEDNQAECNKSSSLENFKTDLKERTSHQVDELLSKSTFNQIQEKRTKRQYYYIQDPTVVSYDYKLKYTVPKDSHYRSDYLPYAVMVDDNDPNAKYFYDPETQTVVKKPRRAKKKKKKPQDNDVGLRMFEPPTVTTTTSTTAEPTVPTRKTEPPISHIREHMYPPYPTKVRPRY